MNKIDEFKFWIATIHALEGATGPDRSIDVDVAVLLGAADEGQRGRPHPHCIDGTPIPHFTKSVEEVEARIRREIPDAMWEFQTEPFIDAHIVDVAPARDGIEPEFWSAAFLTTDDLGETVRLMEKPPANVAIAPTLALLRGMEEVLGFDGMEDDDGPSITRH